MCSIVLSSDQQEHYNRINNDIANSHFSILDTTQTGGGKTIIAIYFALMRGIKRFIIVCNGDIQAKHWDKHRIKYNLPLTIIISYDSLRGSSSTITTPDGKEMLPHGLLYKSGDSYEVSDVFRSYVEEGVFLIADECHLIKNPSGKTDAFTTMSSYITIRNMTLPLPLAKSYVWFSSMTPFDEPEHVINFGMICGIIRSDTLYDKYTDNPRGLMELYYYCKHHNPNKTESIWSYYDIKPKNVNDIAYRLMTEVFLPMTSSFAKNCQKNYLSKQSIYYAYFDIDPMGVKLMKKALDMIKTPVKQSNSINESATKFLNNLSGIPSINGSHHNQNLLGLNLPDYKTEKEDELTTEFNKITFNALPKLNDRFGVIHGMITSQSIKSYYAIINFVRVIFSTVENSKVIIFLSYKEAINIIMRGLPEYNPVKITGDHGCTSEVRNAILSKFNEPNLECRLLIIISQIGSDGIELDDLDGRFPRISLAFPDFYHSRFFQCPGRTLRRYSKSNSLFFLILVNSDECQEESVFKSITNKSRIMDETLKNNEIIPPTYYEKIINPNKADLNKLLKEAGMVKPKVNNVDEISNKSSVIQINRSSISKKF